MMSPANRRLAAAGLSVAMLLGGGGIAHAQDQLQRVLLRGTVHDQDTFSPVSGVLVEVPGLDVATTTDSLGNFFLDLPSAPGYVLYVEQLGYASGRVPVFADDFHLPVFISIAPDPVMLEGLKVVVDRFGTRRRSSISAVRTIDLEDLAMWVGRDMFTVLRARIAFLRRCPRDPFQYCVSSRGRTNRVRVCIDEMPALGGVDQLAAYPPSHFHLIEVYDRGRSIRAYSRRFVNKLTRNPRRLLPLSFGC